METVTWAAFRFLSCDRHLIFKKEKLSNSLLHSLVQILCWIYETNFLPPASLLVAAGFPSGQTPLETKLAEIKLAVQYGAREIDIVISRSLVLSGQWESKSPQARNLNLNARACVCKLFLCLFPQFLHQCLNNLVPPQRVADNPGHWAVQNQC